MRAARIHGHGGPEVLRLDDVPEPTPGPDDLLVRMRATSVNPRDLWIRKGHPHPAYHVELPAILGIDICGEVVEVGELAEGFAPGDRVTANPYIPCRSCEYCRRGRQQLCPHFSVFTGACADYVAVPGWLALAVAPEIPDEHVACFANTYITAWQMLVGKARVSVDDVVFVWAGTSGLGSAAIEIARLSGATVIGSAGSERKRGVLAERGLDLVVDHYSPRMVDDVLEFTDGRRATVVIEHVGTVTWERSLELCASGGTIVSAGATSGDDARMDVTAMFAKQVRILGSRLGTMEDAIAAGRQLSAGRFQPLIGAVLPLEEVAQAHGLLEQGSVAGKIVLTIG
jgi:NADPH:quinone reductase-like Zn-dependent oxidoreductase